jgi:ubiquinone biosynthesis protein Coq4
MEELAGFPEGSLGNDLFRFLERRNLPLLKHYARHDLKHILLDYDTTDEGEACLQSFMLGNGRLSFPVIATVSYGFLTMPEYWKAMRMAFVKGRQSAPIHDWKWNELLTEQTNFLRSKIFTGK